VNIALVIQNAEPQRGGAERYTLNLAADLAARGHDVHLLAQRFARNVEPARQVRLEGAAGSRIGRYQALIRSLDQHLRHTRYDIVHAMLPVQHCDLYHPHAGIEAENLATGHLKHPSQVGRLMARMGNQLNRKRQLVTRVEQEMLEGHDRPLIICLSDYVRQAAMKHYPEAAGRMAVLYNGVDLARFSPDARPEAGQKIRRQFNIPDGVVMALMMSNDHRRKGLRTAIKALSLLTPAQRQKTVLVVVGKEHTTSYERQAEQLGVGERVRFAGPTDDAYSFYQAADLFILPTQHDPCSLVVLESLAMGVPVLTTRSNGAGEVITPGVHGQVIADPNDEEAFAAAWRQALDGGQLAQMRQSCMALRPKLSQQLHVDGLLELYRRARAAT
jgi:UDP-glucose:(heptosyl)LPS alpha-1,3-glucosyltransferase